MTKHWQRSRANRCYSYPTDIGAIAAAPCDRLAGHPGPHTNGAREWNDSDGTSQPVKFSESSEDKDPNDHPIPKREGRPGMKRERGYYWVRPKYQRFKAWTVAEWKNDGRLYYFFLPGILTGIHEERFAEIGPRIIPPNEEPK
jgi:hypothetical protein